MLNQLVVDILENSPGNKQLLGDVMKIAEQFAKDMGKEEILEKFKKGANKEVLELLAKKVYGNALINLLRTIKGNL